MTAMMTILIRTLIPLFAGLAMTLAMRRASAAARHAVWIVALGAALLLPLASVTLPGIDLPLLPDSKPVVQSVPPGHTVTSTSIVIGPSNVSSQASTAATRRETVSPDVSPVHKTATWSDRLDGQILAIVWMVGAIVVLCRWLLAIGEVRRLFAASQPFEDIDWRQLLVEFPFFLRVSQNVELLCIDEAVPPMTWGLIHQVILLPISSRQWRADRLRMVIAHELGHVSRRDGWTQCLAQAACCVYWFNPLVWYAAYRARIEREIACDDMVLNLGVDANDYAGHLLEIARAVNSGRVFALSMADSSSLETRLRAILDSKISRRPLALSVMSGGLCLCATLITVLASSLHLTAMSLPSAPQPRLALIAAPEPVKSIVHAPTFLPVQRPSGPPPAVMDFVKLPAGTFVMGCSSGDTDCSDDEKPAHPVRITNSFEIGKYEVTQGQWRTVMGNNPSTFQGDDLPVETVAWDDVQLFLQTLKKRNDGFQYRLPTEAEWEYAARAGSTAPAPADLDVVAWYGNNSGRQTLDTNRIWQTDRRGYLSQTAANGNRTHPVGQKQPNAFGLYDMLGNVKELVADPYNSVYYRTSPATDPQGPPDGFGHVVRGGWFASSGLGSESTARVSSRRPYDGGTPKKMTPEEEVELKSRLQAGSPLKETDVLDLLDRGDETTGFRVVRQPVSMYVQAPAAQSQRDLVWVNASVAETTSGRIVSGLQARDFRVYEDKVEQSIEAFEIDPVSIGIIIGGMNVQDTTAAHDASVTLLKEGDPRDQYFLVGLAPGSASLLQDFTPDISKVQSQTFGSYPGRLQIFDAMYLSIDELNTAANRRRALVLIVSGDDNSKLTVEETREHLRQNIVQVFVVALGATAAGRANLEAMIPEGGSAFFPQSGAEFSEILKKIGVEIKNQYMLAYHPKNTTPAGLWRKISVHVIPPAGLPDLTVRARSGYYGRK